MFHAVVAMNIKAQMLKICLCGTACVYHKRDGLQYMHTNVKQSTSITYLWQWYMFHYTSKWDGPICNEQSTKLLKATVVWQGI